MSLERKNARVQFHSYWFHIHFRVSPAVSCAQLCLIALGPRCYILKNIPVKVTSMLFRDAGERETDGVNVPTDF